MNRLENEIWLKEKYDQICRKSLTGYTFISLKLKRFRTFNNLYGRDLGEELIERVYATIVNWLAPEEYIAHIHLSSFDILARMPDDLDSLYSRIADLNIAISELDEVYFHGKIFSGLGVYYIKDFTVDFYTAQYNADICRAYCAERDFNNTHFDIYREGAYDYLNSFDLYQTIRPSLEAGDFKLYLQPKVDLVTGMVTSAEALVRWIDPEKGMIPIGEFLPRLEETGLIQDVDLYLFDLVCSYINKWIEEYSTKIKISVNLSRSAFNYLYFIDGYMKVYEKYHSPADCIEFEFLESIVLNKVERVSTVIDQLREKGFSCSLDDFGSGYSSYGVLTTANLSVLKIDRSLFQKESPREQALIEQVINTAHRLGMQTVAEGVETWSYVDFLRKAKCDYIQGYVFYKPMPIDEFEEKFLKNKEFIDFK